jgi:hypothetical protein
MKFMSKGTAMHSQGAAAAVLSKSAASSPPVKTEDSCAPYHPVTHCNIYIHTSAADRGQHCLRQGFITLCCQQCLFAGLLALCLPTGGW